MIDLYVKGTKSAEKVPGGITHCLGDSIQFISTGLALCAEHKSDARFHYCTDGRAQATRKKILDLLAPYEYNITDVTYPMGTYDNFEWLNGVQCTKINPKVPYAKMDLNKAVPVEGLPEKYVTWNFTHSKTNANQFDERQHKIMHEKLNSYDLPTVELTPNYTLAEVAYIVMNAELHVGIDSGIVHFNNFVGTTHSIVFSDSKRKKGPVTPHVQAMITRGCDIENIII